MRSTEVFKKWTASSNGHVLLVQYTQNLLQARCYMSRRDAAAGMLWSLCILRRKEKITRTTQGLIIDFHLIPRITPLTSIAFPNGGQSAPSELGKPDGSLM
jgi:hypothetical protein